MRIAVFAVAVLSCAVFVAPAHAQISRCDNGSGPVFQQGPCAGVALSEPAVLTSVDGTSPGLGPGKNLCAELATVTFGESARVMVLRRWGTEIVKFRGARETAVTYELSIDEKDEHNAYRGARSFYCFVDLKELRVFRISAPLRRQTSVAND